LYRVIRSGCESFEGGAEARAAGAACI
jgi:hypothetical protein